MGHQIRCFTLKYGQNLTICHILCHLQTETQQHIVTPTAELPTPSVSSEENGRLVNTVYKHRYKSDRNPSHPSWTLKSSETHGLGQTPIRSLSRTSRSVAMCAVH